MSLRKRDYIHMISGHLSVKLISRMKSRVTDSTGKLPHLYRRVVLMIDSPETLMMISSSRSLPRQGEGGIDKLDID